MKHRLRGPLTAVLFVATLAAALASPAVSVAQPGNCCCPPGQTGAGYGCAPFCVPGKFLDANTGLCTPIPPQAPPR
jgi:hypothetical protein